MKSYLYTRIQFMDCEKGLLNVEHLQAYNITSPWPLLAYSILFDFGSYQIAIALSVVFDVVFILLLTQETSYCC